MAALVSNLFYLTVLLYFRCVLSEFDGGWLPATEEAISEYYTDTCNIPKIPISEMTQERFNAEFETKPFILTFPHGAADWCKMEYWTTSNLTEKYKHRTLSAGKSIDIVYNGGRGDFSRTFAEFIEEMRKDDVTNGDLTYLFDRNLYFKSSLPSSLNVPDFLFDKGDPILFIGPSGTGATFHKHMPAWNGVIFGQKRWWLYPMEQTPPGGLYAFTPADWLKYVYPNLPADKKPLECIQEAGEIFYVPESMYHAIVNIGETVAISLQKKGAVSALEKEFYEAMDNHYKSTVEEDASQANLLERKSIRQFVDLHFLLPNNTEILNHISEISCDRGATKRCERVANLILQLDPFCIESIKLLSKIHYDRKEYQRSEELLLQGLKVHPTSKSLLREHANFLWDQRRPESKKAFEKVLAVVDPETEYGKEVRRIIHNSNFPESYEAEQEGQTFKNHQKENESKHENEKPSEPEGRTVRDEF